MHILLIGNDFHFEMQNVCRLFLPDEKIVTQYNCTDDNTLPVPVVTGTLHSGAEGVHITVSLRTDTGTDTLVADLPCDVDSNTCELAMTTLLYQLLCVWQGHGQDWGLVTGVRPVKLLRRLTADFGREAAIRHFRNKLLVTPQKLELAQRVLGVENQILLLSRPDSCSLYVSIPFCPTRCDYCSFVSQTVTRAAHLIPQYVECLQRELAHTGDIVKALGLRLETVYFGGGTPTTLSADQLSALFATIEKHFDLSNLREYTVEAGRPDTVTEDKLRAIAAAGIDRISINPQTLQDHVLQAIGRKHTAAQFYKAYDLARYVGFANVNADLIAGLPQDTLAGFENTLQSILSLQPESVTVHTLCLKRASNLVLQHRTDDAEKEDAAAMIAASVAGLTDHGYHPYYLYRQSRAVSNQENTGWAKPYKEGLYNVYIMDETHTILGCGAGAVTKLKDPYSEYLERIFNYKFPYEYNAHLEEMLHRKERVSAFYEERRK